MGVMVTNLASYGAPPCNGFNGDLMDMSGIFGKNLKGFWKDTMWMGDFILDDQWDSWSIYL